ncbi:hypothetical protein F4678DRAFT_478321 [Xylaria arbuscula]|nr:hypothetical protein F4678DRAFT_478321 [Xylaria arbuscula]
MQAPGIRQLPGFACEECRKRKARCDRVQPRCGVCSEYDVPCVTMDKRPRRGPKKGQVDMMRSRIGDRVTLAMLEEELRKRSDTKEPIAASATGGMASAEFLLGSLSEPSATRPEPSCPNANVISFHDGFHDQQGGLAQSYMAWPMEMTLMETAEAVAAADRLGHDGNLASPNQSSSVFGDHHELGDESSITGSRDPKVSNWIRADLDDVYFDRVHKICPMVHQQRYFAWASEDKPSPARSCLRSTMRTLAASRSASYWRCMNELYAESRRLLEESRRAIDSHSTASCDRIQIEYVQAWLLLALYESLRVNEWQAMMTAGYAFRIVQMTRLHELDKIQRVDRHLKETFEPNESFSEREERRRTFWVAYTLDYFLCWRSEWPVTLHEDMVGTRLPAPEVNFQNDQSIITDYLADAVVKGEPKFTSLFSECIVLATLHGRCMAFRKALLNENCQDLSGNARGGHESLAAAVERRVKLLGQSPMMATVERDPMLFFIHSLAHSAIICLSGGGLDQEQLPWQRAENNQISMRMPYEQRASRAMAEMLRLVKALPSFSCFKTHPFLPNSLASAVAFLNSQKSPADDAHIEAETLWQLLRDLCDVNNIAREICREHDIKSWH